MSVKISDVEQSSIAKKAGILKGDTLISIGGKEINDVLDYQFFATDSILSIELLRSGIPYNVKIKKKEYADLGLEFQDYLMDKQRSCRNKCVFCFIDQNPKGMRETVYFKDDDDRLSFLFGNYITLTNLTDHDVDRIIEMKISPINISVHTTDPVLRCEMMGNRYAGKSLSMLYRLAENGVKLNTQLVICPTLNDGEALKKTLQDLGNLFPSVQSIACVPVGVSRYRDGLYPLRAFKKEESADTIKIIEGFQTKFLDEHGERLVFASDEFFLNANIPIPHPEYYGDFEQLDNGVGMIASTIEDFRSTLPLLDAKNTPRHYTLATGKAAFPTINTLALEMMQADPQLMLSVFAIPSRFFGGEITVAGLVTASDIITELLETNLHDALIIPSCMLRHERDKFLDDITLEELSEKLGVEIIVIEPDGGSLAEILEL